MVVPAAVVGTRLGLDLGPIEIRVDSGCILIRFGLDLDPDGILLDFHLYFGNILVSNGFVFD